jgi:ribose/xylose/arabinose/galactoside ABC-type transport system permease subunit
VTAPVFEAPPTAGAGEPASAGSPVQGSGLAARFRDRSFWADWAVFPALAALLLVFGVLNDVFLTRANLEGILAAAAVLVVLAVGQTFVVASAGIDLSIASVVTLSGVVLGQLYAGGAAIGVGIAAAIGCGAAVGFLNGAVVARGRITDFIVTLGTLSVAAGAALVLSDARPVEVTNRLLLDLSTESIGPFRLSVVVALAIAVGAHLLLFHTRFGTHLLAVGGNAEGARAVGIRVDRVKIAAYVISGALAGVASILLVARIGSAEPIAATSLLLNAVAAVVLGGVSLFGGRGTIAGPVAGALLLTALVNGLTLLGVSEAYQPIAVGTVVIASAFLTRYQR